MPLSFLENIRKNRNLWGEHKGSYLGHLFGMRWIVRTVHILTDVTNVVPTEVEVLEPMTIAAERCNQRGKAGGTSVATSAH